MALTARRAVAGATSAAALLAAAALAGLVGAPGARAGDDGAMDDDEARTPAPLGLPDPWYPAGNLQTRARADLGSMLFSDPLLSRDRTVSCATCHPPERAYADGRPLAVGIGGQVQRRHAPTLLNVAYTAHPFWDGRAKSLEDQAGQPIVNPTEMNLTEAEAVERVAASEVYPGLFRTAFGDTTVTFERIRLALAAFERTLLAGDSPFDRWWAGTTDAMEEDAVRGFRLFMGPARCSTCHPVRQSHALFTDDDFRVTGAGKGPGREDPGRFEVTGREKDRGAFKTPTLRNVALTAPYMHDGSLATLEEVVDFYDRGGEPHRNLDPEMRPLSLSERDRRDLVAFLRALTSPVLPGAEDGAALLARRQFAAARDRFLRDLERDAADGAALAGLAEACLGTGDGDHLDDALERLAAAESGAPPGEAAGRFAIWRGRLFARRAAVADGDGDYARGAAHREDASVAFARARRGAPFLDDAWLEGATAEEAAGRPEEGAAVLDGLVERSSGADPHALVARAALRYRLGLAAARAAGNRLDDAARGWFGGAVADERAAAALLPADYGRTLLLARCLHWLAERDAARAAYLAAVPLSTEARDALTGLASLLGGRPEDWTGALEGLVREHPEHATAVYFLAFDRFQRGDGEGAAALFRRLAGLTPAAPMPRVFLGRLARAAGRADEATAHFETALRCDPASAAAVTEWEALLRERPVRGFEDLEAYDGGYRRLVAVCGDRRMRVMARNNLGIVLWEAVSSWTSRGRGRMQYLVEGAPPEALRWMRRCVEVYREAVADLPTDAEMADLAFPEIWAYAGVLNDAGIMLHYFAPVQDLDEAERYYLRSFRITDGAYKDAYFYNLQFLYGFERPGNERRWYRLASVARDAILREDPGSPTGFSADERKRAAAARDWERLRDLLGEEEADRIEEEPLPR